MRTDLRVRPASELEIAWEDGGIVVVRSHVSDRGGRDLQSIPLTYGLPDDADAVRRGREVLFWAWRLVMQYRCDPGEVHDALLACQEYCDLLPDDHPDSPRHRCRATAPAGWSTASQVGDRIRAARIEAQLSRRQLSAACGMSERFLADVESGHANPSIGSIQKIAGSLALTPARLLGEEEAATPPPAPA